MKGFLNAISSPLICWYLSDTFMRLIKQALVGYLGLLMRYVAKRQKGQYTIDSSA